MASSQVEIASHAPFGCVLKDHGRRDGCGEAKAVMTTTQETFHKKLKSLVRDHLHTRASISSGCGEDPQRKKDSIESWFVKERNNDRGVDPVGREGECSSLTPRQARIVDRWAAQQAREMVSTIEKHTQEAELLYKSNSQTSRASPFVRETSPTQSSDTSNRGASSLVQMWEARLCQPIGNSNNANSPFCCSRSNSSALSCIENVLNSPGEDSPTKVEEARQSSEVCFADWESDRTTAAKDPSPTSKGQVSHETDSERGRVANIIKRLTSVRDQNESDQSPAVNSPCKERERTLLSEPSDQKPFLHATSSPRIRGRQAFADLLMQMERDRHEELQSLIDRQAVSRFSQKGRIQSHLKIKILQRGVAVHEQHPLNLFRGPGRNGSPNSPAITLLREKFKAAAELDLKEHNEVADLGASPRESVSCQSHVGISSTANPPFERERGQEGDGNLEQQTEVPVPSSVMSLASKDDQDVGAGTSDAVDERVSYDDPNLERQQSADACSSSGAYSEDEQEANEEVPTESSYDWISKISRPRSYWEDRRQEWYQEMLEENSAKEEIRQLLQRRRVSNFLSSDFRERIDELMRSHFRKQTHLVSQAEEDQIDLDAQISAILQTHDRSAGDQEDVIGDEDVEGDVIQGEEDVVQEREEDVIQVEEEVVQEMKEALVQVEGEIVLESEEDLIQVEEEDEPQDIMEATNVERDEAVEQLLDEEAEEDELQDITEVTDRDRDEEEEQQLDEEMVEEEDVGSISGEQYHEASDHSHHSSSCSNSSGESMMRSWGFDDHDQVVSTYSAQSPRSRAYYLDPLQHSRSIDHLSMEIELINELRGQMKQLQREMSELRRSIKTCMDMQATMQDSMKQEISSGQGEGRSIKKWLRKSSCCICYDKPVDSLLYRCGHMCTCLKCAVKLQFGSGKCPTCRAPIEDVVRAYPDP